MTKREVIKCVLDGKKPPYVPWSFKFTKEPKEALMQYYDTDDLDPYWATISCSWEATSASSKIWAATMSAMSSAWFGTAA